MTSFFKRTETHARRHLHVFEKSSNLTPIALWGTVKSRRSTEPQSLAVFSLRVFVLHSDSNDHPLIKSSKGLKLGREADGGVGGLCDVWVLIRCKVVVRRGGGGGVESLFNCISLRAGLTSLWVIEEDDRCGPAPAGHRERSSWARPARRSVVNRALFHCRHL